MSLADLIEARRGRELLDYIDGLPSACRTREAMLNDPDEAELLAAMPEPEDEWAPRVSEWTLAHALQYDQRALLVAILRQLEATASGKTPKPIPPLPGPRTLVDDVRSKARERAMHARVEALKSEFGYRPPA